jgi:hypothetical protein
MSTIFAWGSLHSALGLGMPWIYGGEGALQKQVAVMVPWSKLSLCRTPPPPSELLSVEGRSSEKDSTGRDVSIPFEKGAHCPSNEVGLKS